MSQSREELPYLVIAFSGTLETRGDVATKREPLAVEAHPKPQNCPLMNHSIRDSPRRRQ